MHGLAVGPLTSAGGTRGYPPIGRTTRRYGHALRSATILSSRRLTTKLVHCL